MVRGDQRAVLQLAERPSGGGQRVHGGAEQGGGVGADHQQELLLPLQAAEHRGLQAGQRSVVINDPLKTHVFIYFLLYFIIDTENSYTYTQIRQHTTFHHISPPPPPGLAPHKENFSYLSSSTKLLNRYEK